MNTALARKIFLPAAVALLALAGTGRATAGACSITGNEPVAFGLINIQPSAAIGDTLAATTLTLSGTCTSSTRGLKLTFITNAWPTTSLPGVWGTNVTGIGMRLTSTTTTPNTGATTMVASGSPDVLSKCQDVLTTTCTYGPDQPATTGSYPITVSMKVELVKTANTLGTQALGGYVFGLSSRDIANAASGAPSAHMFSGTSFGVPTCTRTSADPLVVKLPDLPASQFSAPGATGGDTPFTLAFACGAAKNVLMTMSDVLTAGTVDDKLTLSPDPGSATGVKLQVLYNGVPIKFDPSSQGTTNSVAVGSSLGNNQPFSIPLTVRYVSTGTATPGTVNASAVYTLSYQ